MIPAAGAVSAETYAARKITAALDMFIDPPVEVIADDSGLTVAEVKALVEKLHAKRMKKAVAPVFVEQAPVGRAAPRPGAPPPPVPPVEDWRRGLDHPVQRIRTLAARAVSAIQAVEAALADERGKAALRAKEAKLVRELAKVRAELHGAKPGPKPATPAAPHACDCGRTFSTQRGLAHHNTAAHTTPTDEGNPADANSQG